ncbi:MAG TPA: CHASE3 domain-containing protein [Bryobacteraceae bacterium]|nr:CHASE3 domain-containing protein [Bryobacteraceae bacterium]
MHRQTKHVYPWIALIPILLMISALWSRWRYREEVELADHARAVQQAIYQIQITLAEAEMGRRGFVLTGNRRYLVPVEAAVSRAPEAIERLRELTKDNPAQQENVRVFESLALERAKFLEQTAQIGRTDDEEFRAMERRNGLAVSDQLQDIANRMIAVENRLLEERTKASRAADLQLGALFVFGSVATILLLLWSYRMLQRYTRERDQAASQAALANRKLQEEIAHADSLNRELEERVKARTANLERSNSDLRQFAYVASHDLREPLRMIVTYTALLEQSCQGKLNAEQQQYMGFAAEGAKRMQALIADLIAYTQASAQEPARVPAALDQVLEQARYGLLASVRETGAEIEADPLPELEIDPVKMSLVFQNLLSNAIKFRKPGEKPRIRVGAGRQDGEWRLWVRDEGIGFDPKYSEKIFLAFQRLHPTGKYPGTGVGLAICKRIVEAHGGRIWAESQPGAGSTFYFTLPAGDLPSRGASQASGAATAPIG